ncbi:hypothetical protein SFUMM280S_10696 [Streptomyces fumanus]
MASFFAWLPQVFIEHQRRNSPRVASRKTATRYAGFRAHLDGADAEAAERVDRVAGHDRESGTCLVGDEQFCQGIVLTRSVTLRYSTVIRGPAGPDGHRDRLLRGGLRRQRVRLRHAPRVQGCRPCGAAAGIPVPGGARRRLHLPGQPGPEETVRLGTEKGMLKALGHGGCHHLGRSGPGGHVRGPGDPSAGDADRGRVPGRLRRAARRPAGAVGPATLSTAPMAGGCGGRAGCPVQRQSCRTGNSRSPTTRSPRCNGERGGTDQIRIRAPGLVPVSFTGPMAAALRSRATCRGGSAHRGVLRRR